ncbi:SDR family NAD(P)-dependent oxidoreductase [Kitasatospora kifunensis]|uniref:NAD(P)-dependent dehydrogenase (Short-subunit alcohol dehydrogenase family) n=1 Tax=Kitasatospora kifunensis TaxID=58351 RepID=A0A7W7VVZ1_KITKI|nr:SDR family oxidoreductase [Kitasatospora kifunensis]MBB4924912.1 NAD(P)-dependent dehydrogenase (short-subunit alcohol dehydrogenase family) [Kitasatospora kifunensis]
MDLQLKGKRAVVTGASRGIGLSIVRALVAEGVEVVGGARNPGEELREATAHTYAVDLSTAEGPARLVEHAVETLGGLDILVNNVGGRTVSANGFLDLDDEGWRKGFELNFFSAVRSIRAALPSLLESRGAIVNIGSVNGRLAAPRLAEYGAAKAALTNLTKALSEEFGPKGVRVNTISPGPVLTDTWNSPARAERMGMSVDDLVAAVPKWMSLTTGKIIDPDEVAAIVLLLASDRLPSTTGADWLIDAGMLKSV